MAGGQGHKGSAHGGGDDHRGQRGRPCGRAGRYKEGHGRAVPAGGLPEPERHGDRRTRRGALYGGRGEDHPVHERRKEPEKRGVGTDVREVHAEVGAGDQLLRGHDGGGEGAIRLGGDTGRRLREHKQHGHKGERVPRYSGSCPRRNGRASDRERSVPCGGRERRRRGRHQRPAQIHDGGRERKERGSERARHSEGNAAGRGFGGEHTGADRLVPGQGWQVALGDRRQRHGVPQGRRRTPAGRTRISETAGADAEVGGQL